MPIDLDLLRHQETFEQVLAWQTLRYPHDDGRSLLEGIQQADGRLRETRGELNASRNELKAMQRSLAPQHAAVAVQNVSVSTRQDEIRLLKARILAMESAIDALQQEIAANMTRVANSIDVELPLLVTREDGGRAPHGTRAAIMDPMFCIRGYEQVRLGDSATPTAVVLTGVGASLERAVTSHALTFLRDFALVSLPTDLYSMHIPCSLARSMLGCNDQLCTPSSSIAAVGSTPTPEPAATLSPASALLGMSLLHRNMKYYDRQLPLRQVCLTGTKGDQRETCRRASFSSKRNWFGGGERVEVLCLTGCTLAESRAVQLEMLELMQSFYRSTVLDGAATPTVAFQTTCVVDPTLLLPNEASRMVLAAGPMILGYVSNLTDYVTRGVSTQCGSIHIDYVHTLHGCFCSIRETIEFMLQHNVVTHDVECGVGVPACVAVHRWEGGGDGEWFFVPFQRRVEAHRGKVTLTALHGATHPRWVGHRRTKLVDSQPSATATAATTKSRVFAIEHKGVPTRKDVEAEALMSPFPFLPM